MDMDDLITWVCWILIALIPVVLYLGVTLHDDGTVPDYYQPSVDWEQGGAIIECEKIDTYYGEKGWWQAVAETNDVFAFGTTPLIAAMRCYVASKLGDEIELPEGLK